MGMQNVKNPKTGKLENLLKPNEQLTEAQFLSVLFKYAKPDELKSTKAKTDHWASVQYQLAEKYNQPTKATLKNTSSAGKPITRGRMAQILASLDKGKVVSEQTAVQFMYDAKLSNGRSDAKGNYPMTYKSYGANDPLMRAHIVTFMKNYDTYLSKKK